MYEFGVGMDLDAVIDTTTTTTTALNDHAEMLSSGTATIQPLHDLDPWFPSDTQACDVVDTGQLNTVEDIKDQLNLLVHEVNQSTL
jgi:hypothetical protein